MAITKLVIDRAKWGTSALLSKDGTMCCLGFLSKACGVPDEDMLDVPYPRFKWVDMFGVNTEFAARDFDVLVAPGTPAPTAAAAINDSSTLSMEQKETQLIELFANNGIELSFTGEKRE